MQKAATEAIRVNALMSYSGKRNILSTPARVIVFALAVACTVSVACAQSPYVFRKDLGANQQIEYMTDVFNNPSFSPVPGALATNLAPAAITFNGSIFLFAVKPDSTIWMNTLPGGCGGNWKGWIPFPPGGTTDVAVAPVLFAGSLFVIGKGINDKQLYITWSSNGTSWVNWQLMDPAHSFAAVAAPAAIALTDSNSSPYLLVVAKDASNNLYMTAYYYSANVWTGWEYLSYADLGPSVAKYASFTFTPGNCPPGDFCPVISESDTLYISVAVQLPDTPGKTIWTGASPTGIWTAGSELQAASPSESLPITPAAPAVYGYPSVSGGPGVLVFANAYGNFEGFKQSVDPGLKSWGPWHILPGLPSDVAVAVTDPPSACL